jgi:hypothetical protein
MGLTKIRSRGVVAHVTRHSIRWIQPCGCRAQGVIGAEAVNHTGGRKGTRAFGLSRDEKRFSECEAAAFVRWLEKHENILTAAQTMREMYISGGITKTGHVIPCGP